MTHYAPQTGGDAWQTRVRYALQDGWGVEDIALHLRCDVKYVRAEVKILRETGELAKFYGRRV